MSFGVRKPAAAGKSGVADDAQSQAEVEAAMGRLYDHYFACHDYEKRYPHPNRATLHFLLTHGAVSARNILDFGCGNGRYALALLQSTGASLTGYDISLTALREFQTHVEQSQFGDRVRLVHGPATPLESAGRHDMILMLFGVLSHLGMRPARITALRQLHAVIEPNGKLIVTVPCMWRRRPGDLLNAAIERLRGRASGPRAEAGNILFTRVIGGVPNQFFYHLYTVRRLRQELLEGGFVLQGLAAESILPEWLITQHPFIGWIDAQLSRLVPASWGYGIRAIATPA
jgi:SAM-dependent methyltransferase